MSLSRKQLRAMILEELRTLSQLSLNEAEGDEPAEDAEDAFGDTEGGDTEAGAKTAPEGDAAEETVPKKEAEKQAEKAKDQGAQEALATLGPVGEPIARAILAARDDARERIKNVIEPGSKKDKDPVSDSLWRVGAGLSEGLLSRLIFEAGEKEDPDLDVSLYARRIANLITNYDSLLDMKKTIFDAAYEQLLNDDDYGQPVADQFKDILARDYDLVFDHDYDPEKADRDIYAVGATPSGGGGA